MAADGIQSTPAIGAVTLGGDHVRLVPLALEHLPALIAAGADASIWRWYSVDGSTPETMRAFVADALEGAARGATVPFAVLETATGTVVGSTRFGAIERAHRRAEIGWTFLTPRCQRTGINTEMKYLMLRHAFEVWELLRVEFKTDSLNAKSRNALKRIGAVEEGTLRNHMVTYTGRIRDSVYFGITCGDWPAVKRGLEEKMRARAATAGEPR